MRTINGKKLEDVFKELQAEFPARDIRRHNATQKLYITASKMKERLDTVLGDWNWDFIPTSEPQLWKLGPDAYESCVLSGKLIIYDDDRVPIVRGAVGGADLIYPKGERRPTSVANAVDSAHQDVFKRCCRRFGIGKVNQNSNTGSDNEGRFQPETVCMDVTVLGVFQALSRGGARVKVLYREEPLDLLIWAQQWEELSRMYPGTFQIGHKINSIRFQGKTGSYKGKKRIEFCQLAPADRKIAG